MRRTPTGARRNLRLWLRGLACRIGAEYAVAEYAVHDADESRYALVGQAVVDRLRFLAPLDEACLTQICWERPG